ncbi:hypothetical protein HAX54_049150 [Datura stramonium]|uniref:START domain-containing protein n=1 Tax=Datura stramonium TaxID=4076 RepID=A0ABS8WMD2_DATST|nr:hypothetical protein [Datura stramonium]
MAMRKSLKNIYCPQCDGPPIVEEERELYLENLRKKNQKLRDEHERISNLISSAVGGPFLMNPKLAQPNSALMPNSTLRSPTNTCGSPIEYPPLPIPHQENNNNNNIRNSMNINNIPIISPLPLENYVFHHDDKEKLIIFEIVVAAMREMVELLKVNNPIWVKSSIDERCFIDRDSYNRKFPNSNRPYKKSSTTRIESSRYCGVVPMTAISLIQNFLDPVKWMNMFPTIVTKARIIEVFDTENLGGSVQLMYEKVHVLSPLVGSRDFFFIRCCRQIDSTIWIMVDVSYDLFKEIQSPVPSHSWKFPSGCIIKEMGNGQSMVTWIEHVQADDNIQIHRIYRDLFYGCQTYGAKRWIVTLQRMSERYNFAMGATCPTRHDLKGVVIDPKGMKNVMQISQRMVKSFCEVLSMTDKLDFPTSSQLNSENRVSIRKNEEITQPKGFIITASTSLWLPLPFQTVFNFFKDDKIRPQWDILTSGNDVTELARVLTGTFLENNITIIQPYAPNENNMFVLQESSIDDVGAFIIYAPIDSPTINSIINEDDVKKVPILPSGLIISPDGRLASNKNNVENASNGSILTVAFQKSICANNNSISQQQAVATIESILSSTVLKIKTALNCLD